MPEISRRNLIRGAAVVGGAAAMSGTVAAESANAATAQSAAHKPGGTVHGDLRDVKHVVILMQENRSFDHYFGTLQGVRGFGDRAGDPAARRLLGVQPAPTGAAAGSSTRGT